jgi:hypothetical protein
LLIFCSFWLHAHIDSGATAGHLRRTAGDNGRRWSHCNAPPGG